MRTAVFVMSLAGIGCGLHDVNNDAGGAINLAVVGDHLAVARGTEGIDIVHMESNTVAAHADPSGDGDSYDDVAASEDGATVLVHDADDGLVDSFQVDENGAIALVTRELSVESGPYSGLSVSGGTAIVSGGTCGIARLSVGGGGELALVETIEVFRGQPDVTMVPFAGGALLSTHFSGDEDEYVDGHEFGVSTFAINGLALVASMGLAGAGFTEGGGRPASWPVRASVVGDLVAVAHGGGLELLRIGPNLHIERLSHLDLPFRGVDAFMTDPPERVFVVGAEPAQFVEIDVSLVFELTLLRTIEIPAARPTAVAVGGGRIFVADSEAGLVVLDL